MWKEYLFHVITVIRFPVQELVYDFTYQEIINREYMLHFCNLPLFLISTSSLFLISIKIIFLIFHLSLPPATNLVHAYQYWQTYPHEHQKPSISTLPLEVHNSIAPHY